MRSRRYGTATPSRVDAPPAPGRSRERDRGRMIQSGLKRSSDCPLMQTGYRASRSRRRGCRSEAWLRPLCRFEAHDDGKMNAGYSMRRRRPRWKPRNHGGGVFQSPTPDLQSGCRHPLYLGNRRNAICDLASRALALGTFASISAQRRSGRLPRRRKRNSTLEPGNQQQQ